MDEYNTKMENLVDGIKSQGYNSICFWLPTRNVGGGASTFCELAKFLMTYTDMDVYYMDCPDGYAHDLSQGTQIRFLSYSDEQKKFPLKEPTVIITNSTRVIQIKNMHPESKFVFWHWESAPSAWNIVFLDNEVKSYLQMTKECNAMIFHDWSAKKVLNSVCNTNFGDGFYFPLYVPQKDRNASKTLINDNQINIAWLSRLANEKVCSLYNLIDNLDKYQTTKRKRLHIIGDGLRRKDVEAYCQTKTNNNADIEFIFTGTIPNNQLDDYLLNNADILFGMGTSILEGAALGIPSVIVQLDFRRFSDDEFIWLHNTIDYCVGIYTNQKKDFPVNFTSFNNIMYEIFENSQKAYFGEKSYLYYKENHSDFHKLAYKLLYYIKNSTLTFNKLKSCIKYVPYNHLKVIEYKTLGKAFFKIFKFDNEKKIYFFKVLFLVIKRKENHTSYHLFGKRAIWHRFEKTAYNFPATKIKG